MRKRRVIICGAGGRDFHNFLTYFLANRDLYEVVAWTFTQVPAEIKSIPKEIAGKEIPVYPEEKLEEAIEKHNADLVVFCYSDVSHQHVMDIAARAAAKGCSFMLLGPKDVMLESKKPVIAVCAVRTGAGKSSVSRKVVRRLSEHGVKVAVIRHPMIYMDPRKMLVQVFRTLDDLDKWNVTYEEREEYEPYLRMGYTVYAGVDYRRILELAEKEADVILWDGGNNDWPFYKPNLMFVVADALRAGHELTYWPGSVCVRMADVVVINKVVSAGFEKAMEVEKNVRKVNPRATIIWAESRFYLEPDVPDMVRGKRTLVIEDAPTVTHGEAGVGAGYYCALRYGAEIVDPRDFVKENFPNSDLARMYREWPVGPVIPSLGYTGKQKKELEEIINALAKEYKVDVILNASPIDFRELREKGVFRVSPEIVNVRYEIVEVTRPTIADIVDKFIEELRKSGRLAR